MGDLSLHDGMKQLAQKRYKDVHAASIHAIGEDPLRAVPYFLLGLIAEAHDNHLKAEELFERAEKLDDNCAYFPAYLARLYSQTRLSEKAKVAADRAAILSINDGHLADMIGVVYSRSGFHELAIPMFERAIALDPKKTNYHYNHGASAQFMGDFDIAESAYKKAIKLDEDHYHAWASLVSLKKQTTDHNHLTALQQQFEKSSGNEDATHQIGHAIAKTLEDLEQHEDSFDWLVKAKQNKRQKFGYDRTASSATFQACKETIDNPLSIKASTQTPIFIIGLPRTGTTLVDRILSSHSEVISAGELNIFAELIKAQTKTPSNLVLDAETFAATSKIDMAQIGRNYMDRARQRVNGSDFIVDKMPLNFFYAALIHQALPNARIIALRRGAMDSCLSNYRQLLSVQESFYNYTFDIEDTAFFYRQYDALMTHWRDHLPANRFMEVRYEDIVFDQENQTRRLLDFCGLGFEDACMRFHENTAPVATASAVQVRQPLYSGSIDRWKKYGDKLDGLKAALGGLAG